MLCFFRSDLSFYQFLFLLFKSLTLQEFYKNGSTADESVMRISTRLPVNAALIAGDFLSPAAMAITNAFPSRIR
jgi:hypothetical protein